MAQGDAYCLGVPWVKNRGRMKTLFESHVIAVIQKKKYWQISDGRYSSPVVITVVVDWFDKHLCGGRYMACNTQKGTLGYVYELSSQIRLHCPHRLIGGDTFCF